MDTSPQAQRLLVRGLTYAQLDDHERAAQLFQEALERAPQEAALMSALADALAAQDETDMALYYARQAHNEAPENHHYTHQLARLYEEAGRRDEAISTYRTLIDTTPRNAEAYQALAQLLADDGQPRAAVETYQQMVDHLGASARTYVKMLRLYRRLDDSEGLRQTLEKLVDRQPSEPYFRRQLAELYEERGQLERATSVYQRALDANPHDVSAALQLADLYRRQGRDDAAEALLDRTLQTETATADQLVERVRPLLRRVGSDSSAAQSAESLLERAVEMDPENETALRMLGELRYQEGAFQEAGDLLVRALDQNPRAPERWAQAASAFLQADRPERAAEVAEEGLLLFPGQLPLVRISAYALMETNQNAQAIARFQEALELLGEDAADQRANFLAALGLLYSRQDNVETSDAHYERALEADPTHTLALNNYAYSLAERGTKLDRALEMAQTAVELDPSNASFLDTLGWVHYQLGNHQDARERLIEAIDTGEATATVYEHLGDVYDALNQPEAAHEYWQKALDRAPNRSSLQQKLESAVSEESK